MHLLLFTGYSASGKSTLAHLISESLRFEFLGEREILHQLALRKGFTRSRFWLLSEGPEDLITSAREETLNRLRQVTLSNSAILDGAYDSTLPDLIKEGLPHLTTTIIAIHVPRDIRLTRIHSRLGSSSKEAAFELAHIDDFKKRAGIDTVIKQADITLDNSLPLSYTIAELSQQLRERRIY